MLSNVFIVRDSDGNIWGVFSSHQRARLYVAEFPDLLETELTLENWNIDEEFCCNNCPYKFSRPSGWTRLCEDCTKAN